MKIGSAIKSIRKKLGITQSDLAVKCSLSQTSLSLIEGNQKRPSRNTVTKICEVMDIPEFVIYVVALGESEVPASKVESFKIFYPIIMKLTLQMLDEEHVKLIEGDGKYG